MDEAKPDNISVFEGNSFNLKPFSLSLSLISSLTSRGMNMQSSSTVFKEKNQFGKVERCINVGRPVHFMLCSLLIATIFSIFLLYSPNPLILMTKKGLDPVLKQQEASSPTQGHDSVQKQIDQDKPHKSNFQNNFFFYLHNLEFFSFYFFIF